MTARDSLIEVLRHRPRVGIPGGLVEGMEDTFPADSEWGVLVSEREAEALAGLIVAANDAWSYINALSDVLETHQLRLGARNARAQLSIALLRVEEAE